MKRTFLSMLSTEDLVEMFVEKGLAASAADAVLDNGRANRLHLEEHKIGSEIARRGPAAQLNLLPLMDHPNECIRMMAAVYGHSLAPEKAHEVLAAMSAHGDLPYCFLADVQLDKLGYESRFSRARSAVAASREAEPSKP